MLYEIEDFCDNIRMVLRIPPGELETIPDREAKRDEGLTKFKKELKDLRNEYQNICIEGKMNNGNGRIKEIHDEIEEVCGVIENLIPWHPLKQNRQEKCICDDYPSMACPLHPGRN